MSVPPGSPTSFGRLRCVVAEATGGVPEATGVRFAVEFAGSLREAGLDVPIGSVIVFVRALGKLGLHDRDLVYWAGRSSLVRRREDVETYDSVFIAFFERSRVPVDIEQGTPAAPGPAVVAGGEESDDGQGEQSPDERVSLGYSALERLRRQDFARYGEAEWQQAQRLIASLRATAEERRSRRSQISGHGRQLDLARTVQLALASDGEALRRVWRRPSQRPRRLVLIIDISGSMEPYARAFLRFAHAAVSSRPTGAVEVFAMGTRVSRLTRRLASRDADAALAAVARHVDDWFGGTRLGEGLRSFNDTWGTRGTARGSVVVFLSDGWDRGEPDQLSSQMGRLGRVAHRVVWVNPLRASPGYEPIARGMAAALPFVDNFVDGHCLASLEQLAEVLRGLGQQRSLRWPSPR
ncbi:MAG: vWA domain-containing protein [Acidimicrobiales bacterium]